MEGGGAFGGEGAAGAAGDDAAVVADELIEQAQGAAEDGGAGDGGQPWMALTDEVQEGIDPIKRGASGGVDEGDFVAGAFGIQLGLPLFQAFREGLAAAGLQPVELFEAGGVPAAERADLVEQDDFFRLHGGWLLKMGGD